MSWKYWINKKSIPFISVWNTANTSAGSSASNQVKLPFISTGTYNCRVDWGDSSSDIITSWNQTEVTHTYASTGSYTITISGQCEGFGFGNSGDRLKITGISQFGGTKYSNVVDPNGGVYYGCTNLNVSAIDSPIFLGGAAGFFRNCSSLTGTTAFNDWNMTPCTDTRNFFAGCTLFNRNIGGWDMSNVTNITAMFGNCTAFNNGGSADINNWNTSSVTGFSELNAGLFVSCTNFNQPLNDWNMSGCTNTTQMFQSCTNFNQPLNNWDMSNVTTMQNMFAAAPAFNQNIGAWNVGAVTVMQGMFNAATAFNNGGNDSIKNWNTGSVQVFGNSNAGMFFNATNFNQPLNWNTVSATNMRQMFQGATAFNQNIGSWNISNLAGANALFNFMSTKTPDTFSASNLDAIYNGWSGLTFVNTGFNISFGTAKYTAAGSSGKAVLTGSPNNWTITDGGI